MTGRVGRLRGHLEHYSYRNLTDHLVRMQGYAALMAQALYSRGKRCGLGKVLINPLWRFVRGYLLRRLDDQARALEQTATGPSFDAFVAAERSRSTSLGGRSVFGWEADLARGDGSFSNKLK